MIINCAIIDDEPLAVEMLEQYVERTPFLHLTGAYNSAVTAIKPLRDNPVDLLFLDIQMPELSGLEFAKLLPSSTKIVFTTAFSQYAIEGYEVDAIGYLVKPITYESFLKAARKALTSLSKEDKLETLQKDRFLFLKCDYKLVKIHLDDILYIEGLKDYVRFYLENGEKIMTLMNMKTLEDNLPKPEFMRAHRSYIVHMCKIQGVDKFRLVFNDTMIQISDSYKDAISNFLDKHTIS